MFKKILLKCAAASVILFSGLSMQAQEATPEKGMKKEVFVKSLSEAQQADYASFKESKKSSKAALEATFSPDQLAILNNKELDKKAKREALKATYTDAQKEQRKADAMANKSAKDAFIATLSEEQKALMPKGLQGAGKKGGKKGKKKAE